MDKDHWFYKFSGSSDAAFGTSDYDLHRVRRGAQRSYFTQSSIARFLPKLDSIIDKLCTRLQEFKVTGQPVNLANAYRSLATDAVTEFAFHKSYNLLDPPDFAAAFHRNIRNFPELGIWHRHFGIILGALEATPAWLVRSLSPTAMDVQDFFNVRLTDAD